MGVKLRLRPPGLTLTHRNLARSSSSRTSPRKPRSRIFLQHVRMEVPTMQRPAATFIVANGAESARRGRAERRDLPRPRKPRTSTAIAEATTSAVPVDPLAPSAANNPAEVGLRNHGGPYELLPCDTRGRLRLHHRLRRSLTTCSLSLSQRDQPELQASVVAWWH